MTAEIASRNGGKVTHAVDEECRFREVVFLGQLAEKRRCGVCSSPF
ncbi:hypothetical protein [Haladaptatus halobius]